MENDIIKMFNHGMFQMVLQEKLEELHRLKSKEIDPYKQWNYADQIALTEELLVKYKNTVNIQLA